MKRYLFLIPIAFIITNCSSQTIINTLRNVKYYSISSNKRIAEISLSEDSLIITETPSQASDRRAFEIVSKEEKSGYVFYYVKLNPFKPANPKVISSISSKFQFGVFILSLSKDKNELFILSERKLYTSMDEVKARLASYSKLDDDYFATWYAETTFKKFISYPNFMNADKTTVQKVADEWINELKQNIWKMQNMANIDFFGTIYTTDVLTKILIANNLSPVLNSSEFSKKITEDHIVLPVLPIIRKESTPPLKNGGDNLKEITIDAPAGNR